MGNDCYTVYKHTTPNNKLQVNIQVMYLLSTLRRNNSSFLRKGLRDMR